MGSVTPKGGMQRQAGRCPGARSWGMVQRGHTGRWLGSGAGRQGEPGEVPESFRAALRACGTTTPVSAWVGRPSGAAGGLRQARTRLRELSPPLGRAPPPQAGWASAGRAQGQDGGASRGLVEVAGAASSVCAQLEGRRGRLPAAALATAAAAAVQEGAAGQQLTHRSSTRRHGRLEEGRELRDQAQQLQGLAREGGPTGRRPQRGTRSRGGRRGRARRPGLPAVLRPGPGAPAGPAGSPAPCPAGPAPSRPPAGRWP